MQAVGRQPNILSIFDAEQALTFDGLVPVSIPSPLLLRFPHE